MISQAPGSLSSATEHFSSSSSSLTPFPVTNSLNPSSESLELSHIRISDLRVRNELVAQEEIDRASALMDAKGVDMPLREGMDVDAALGLSED